VLAVVGIAVGLGVAAWMVRRRGSQLTPDVAPDAFGVGVAATEGPAVAREPAALG
jgi:hypothetical protein